MKLLAILFSLLISLVCFGEKYPYNIVNEAEINQLTKFCDEFLYGNQYPFHFYYDKFSSSELLSKLEPSIKKNIDFYYIDLEKTWKNQDGLIIKLIGRQYLKFPVVEWTLYLKNDASRPTPVISELNGLALNFKNSSKDESIIVHANRGDDCSARSFLPYDVVLSKGKDKSFYPTINVNGYPSGKSTDGDGWPYWNIQNENHGIILSLGWPGSWRCNMANSEDGNFILNAGQRDFASYLKPGEEIRTPLVSLMFWDAKDVLTSQNMWRRFYLAHIIPHFNGIPEQPASQIQCALKEGSINYVKGLLSKGIKPRICWNDANWYPSDNGTWIETGNWFMKTTAYPNGGRPFVDWAHSEGMDCLLWFEPERVYRGNNYLYKNKKEWLLPLGYQNSDILNEGNVACRTWIINRIDSIIKANDLDWYREDMNGTGPYDAWTNNDKAQGANRKGITENFYVQGHLAYLDSLKARNTKLHFDNCASGGRRNDLESMKRGVPLLRSDYQWPNQGDDLVRGNQGHTWALSSWLPFQGSGCYLHDKYSYRSFYLPGYGIGNVPLDKMEEMKRYYNECGDVAPIMLYGDYWPLTSYNIDKDKWIAWQFNREETTEGCIQAFRRENCSVNYIKVKLRGLDDNSHYEVYNYDSNSTLRVLGKDLMNDGFTIFIDEMPGSALIKYRKVN